MTPVTSGFQVAIDTKISLEHPTSTNIGVGADGRYKFSGASIREMTDQFRNGVLRVANLTEYFDLELYFIKGAGNSSLIYRQCAGPQTVLLFVVNPELPSGGDWLWVKSGKYAK